MELYCNQRGLWLCTEVVAAVVVEVVEEPEAVGKKAEAWRHTLEEPLEWLGDGGCYGDGDFYSDCRALLLCQTHSG